MPEKEKIRRSAYALIRESKGKGEFDWNFSYHEAGHAIVATQYGFVVNRIELKGFNGAVYDETTFTGVPTHFQRAVTILAGAAAEAIFIGKQLLSFGRLVPDPMYEFVRMRLNPNQRDRDAYSKIASLDDIDTFKAHAEEALAILQNRENYSKWSILAAYLQHHGGIVSNVEFVKIFEEGSPTGDVD